MKLIIAATDFSPVAQNAVRYAVDLALWKDAELRLLHVSPLPIIINEVPVPLPVRENNDLEALTILRDEIVQQTADKIKVTTDEVMGTITGQLQRYCHDHGADLLVIGAETRHGIGRLFSATTLEAIRDLRVPFIVVPADAGFSILHRIGLACDLASDSLPMEKIAALVQAFRAQLHVIHINDRKAGLTVAEMERAMSLRIQAEGLHPVYHFIGGDDPATEVAAAVAEKELDMLIVVPRNHGLLGKVFHHSAAKALAIHTHIPLLVIHE